MPKHKKARRLKKTSVARAKVADVIEAAPRLIFPRSGVDEGFTHASLSAFRGDTVSSIRELIQNSLDAAVQAEVKTAHVRFEIGREKLSAIPGLVSGGEYWSAYEGTKKRDDFNNPTSVNVWKKIKRWEGDDDQETSVLFVSDNGVGLDEERMGAVLSDGVSKKDVRTSSGSFGNGHLTTLSLSDLRYVLYGGVPMKGGMIFAGHAILASHIGEGGLACGKDGYFVRGIHDDKLGFGRFDYVDAGDVPDIFRSRMNRVKEEWNHGSLIAIPAFNNFGEAESDIADVVCREAALNFFAAIHQEKLRIEVVDKGGTVSLGRDRLNFYLEKEKEKKRARVRGFPSGSRAWDSYTTLIKGERHELPISRDKVTVYVREGGGGKKIALCRNGMWIIGDSKLDKGYCAECVNFDALLLVEGPGEAHNVIRGAETPLHNDFNYSALESAEKKELNGILSRMQEGISNVVEKKSDDPFSPDDIFPIEVSDAIKGNRNTRHGKIEKISRRTRLHVIKNKDKESREKKKRKIKPGRALFVKYSSRQVGPGIVRAVFAPEEDCENVELRLSLDGGADPTCAGLGKYLLNLREIRADGKPIAVENEKGEIQAFRLGKWESGKRYNVEIDYVPVDPDDKFTLIVDLVRGKEKNAGIKEAASDE